MSDERPQKRFRLGPDTGGYHDSVPFGDDYNIVHSHDIVSRRVGSTTHSAHTERLAQPDTSWDSTISWAPFDDPEYFLDPDGEGYDEVLEANVMDDVPIQPGLLRPKKKHL
ncbi:hypothetical protein GALMADRAFT_143474 [Galerina marginata CBS 339.88]|uniref:Uncharacterized protein n=1 Tax=Galerina marginata (strain CBS 339.88) TaxID=685588 RepID=A0A067SMJ2_GALM3|nr:hypothetical protein GALMADRAFT_143474 [Galerina marginata CBS 339.88]